MLTTNKVKLGMITLSSVAILAACNGNGNGNGDTLGTTPVEPQPTQEENTVEESTQQEENQEGTQENTSEETGTDTEQENSDSEDSSEENNQENTQENTDQSETTSDQSNTNQSSNEAANSDSPGIENIDFPITVQDAIQIFNNEFGSPYIDEIEFEREGGRYVYDIEGWDGEFEYEMEIDAQTGEILSQEVEADTDQGDILNLDGIMSPQEAMAIALDVSGGSYVEEWELEVEDGYTVYDVDIEGGEDQDVDAHTGDIR